LAVKWRLFVHLLEGGDGAAVDVYRAHIMGRTGGVERGSWKRTADDYLSACSGLVRSMQAVGFDPSHPVIIGANDMIRAGAHRTACAVALGIVATVQRIEKPGRSRPWDAAWMRRSGLPAGDIARAERDTERLRHGADCRCHRS
jgi:hypothetical protein